MPEGDHQWARAQRHRLLSDARRLAIVEALEEGPRQIPELSRLLGIHPTTVRAHLDKLLAAGALEEEPGIPAGRGRPSKRYRLREPLLSGDTELRLFVASLVALLRRAYGDGAVAVAAEEGVGRGRQYGRAFRHPSPEQTAQEVVGLLERLSFAPAPPVRRDGGFAIEVRRWPLDVDPRDPDGAIVCAFHEGLVQGVAEIASGTAAAVRLVPYVAPDVCRFEISLADARPASHPANG